MLRAMRFLSGFIIGMFLGAGVGLLLAPQSGEETVRIVQSRIEGVMEEGRQAAEQTRAGAHARLAELKEGQE